MPNVGPWLITYAHDRRAHRHRCRCCGKILDAGMQVYMAKTRHATTHAIHADCATVKFGGDESTWNQLEGLAAHAAMYADPDLWKRGDVAITAAAHAAIAKIRQP